MASIQCSRPATHALGDLVVAWGNLEQWVTGGIVQLISGGDATLEQIAFAVCAEMSFDRKVHALYSIYKVRFPTEAENPELRAIVNGLFAMQERRNQMLHSAWILSEDGRIAARLKSSAKAKRFRGLPNPRRFCRNARG